MRTRAVLIAAALALGSAACGNDGASLGDDDTSGSPDAGVPEPPGGTFTSFVIDQVLNHTANDTEPVPFEGFANLVDPDTDNPAAYDSLFP